MEDGKVNLEKVDTANNVADALKKLVNIEKFRWCSESMAFWPIAASSCYLPVALTRCLTSGRMLGIRCHNFV